MLDTDVKTHQDAATKRFFFPFIFPSAETIHMWHNDLVKKIMFVCYILSLEMRIITKNRISITLIFIPMRIYMATLGYVKLASIIY